MKKIEPMTNGSISKHLIFFSLPLLLGNLFQQLYNTVDSLIVGNYLGSNALAAVSSSGSLIFMLIGFLSGISSGAGVIIARYFGAEDTVNVRRAVHTTVSFGLVASLFMTAVGMILSTPILIWMGTPSSVMHEASTYLKLYFAGSIGFVMYNIFVGILQAVGDSRHPLYYLIISSIINVILDVLFINVFLMGVAGAALATVISQLFSALLCFFQLTKEKGSYRLVIRDLCFDFSMLKKIIVIGLPSGIQNSIIAFANVVVQSYINIFGEMAMAGYGAYTKIEGFAFLPINSFTMALTTFVSQNLGAQKQERTIKGARFGIILTVCLAQLVGVLVFLFAPSLIGAFDSTADVIRFGVEKARASAPFYFLLAYSHSIAAILRGASKTVIPMIVMMVTWCLIRVAFLTITIPITHSIQMVYIVYPITWTLSSLILFFYYKRASWLSSLGG